MVNFDATIKYQENCNYNASIKQDIIEVPLLKTDATLNVINNSDAEKPLYYNDEIKCTATITHQGQTIQFGTVNFFYLYQDDYLQEWHQINDKPLKLSEDGTVSIVFMPHKDVQFKIEYFGEPYYQDCSNISGVYPLEEIPTKVIFDLPDKEYSTHFVNPKDTVKMTVSVYNAVSNTPINYGVVTFLHYFTHNIDNAYDGVEKVIGNPAFVKDGKATITYSPMQLRTIEAYDTDNESSEKYSEWDIFKNIELISAVYNYDNNAYGEKWHYYKMHQDYTTISVLKPDTINIDIQKEKDGERVPLHIDRVNAGNINKTEELFTIADNESFILSAQIISDKGESIGTQGNKVIFIIADDDVIVNEIDAEYNENTNQFEVIVDKLLAGSYRIYAQIPEHEKYNAEDITLIKREEKIITDTDGMEIVTETVTEITTDNNQNKLQNIRYLQSTQSEDIYLEVEPAEIHCELNLSAESLVYTIDAAPYDRTNITLSANIDDPFLLHNKKCYFLINNQKYNGTIQYINNTLIGHPDPDKNINMSEVNDYVVRAYIPNGVYTYNDGTIEISKTLPTVYSNTIVIKARKEMNIEMNNFTIQNKYPGSVKFYLKANNLYTDILDIRLSLNGQQIEPLYQLSANKIERITIDNIDVGTNNQITAMVINEDISIPAITSQQFNIEKNTLKSSLYNNQIIAAKQQTIPIGLYTENNTNINEIDINKLSITITDPSNEEFNNITNIMIDDTMSNPELLYLLITLNDLKHIEGDWKLSTQYQEDEHYIMTADNFFIFNTYNSTPIYLLRFDVENNLISQITYNGTYNNDNQVLNLTLIFTDDNETVIATIEKETDEHGNFIVNDNDFVSINDWNTWTNMTIIYDEEQNTEVIGYKSYEETFNRRTIRVETNVITGDNELQP